MTRDPCSDSVTSLLAHEDNNHRNSSQRDQTISGQAYYFGEGDLHSRKGSGLLTDEAVVRKVFDERPQDMMTGRGLYPIIKSGSAGVRCTMAIIDW